MANKFFTALGKFGKEALKEVPQIVSTVYPPLSGLMGVVSSLTLKVQAEVGPGQNDTKKQMVLDDLGMFEPFIAPLISQLSGKSIDPAAFDKLVSDIIDITVQWHKLVGVIPTPNNPQSQSPAPAVPGAVSPVGIPGVVVLNQ